MQTMKILFIGDIVGKPGRLAIRELLPLIVEDYRIEFVIANCENAAAGFGVTRDVVEELYQNRIDVLTSGNHIWDKKEVLESSRIMKLFSGRLIIRKEPRIWKCRDACASGIHVG